VARWARRAPEHRAEQRRRLRRRPDPERGERGGSEPRAGGRHGAEPDAALRHLGDDGLALERDLVEAPGAVYHPGALGPETDERLGDGLDPAAVEDADHLAAHASRVGERAEHVEERADTELAARADRVPHRGLERRRVEEDEAGRAEARA